MTAQMPTVEDDPTVYEAENLPDCIELPRAVLALFQDLNRLRQSISHIWTLYAGGTLPLCAASAAFECAIEIANKLQEEFFDAFPSAPPIIDLQRQIAYPSHVNSMRPETDRADLVPSGRRFEDHCYIGRQWAFLTVDLMLEAFSMPLKTDKVAFTTIEDAKIRSGVSYSDKSN